VIARLKAGDSTGEAFREIASACLAQVSEHEKGALGREAEALH
jgi:hypothetical protein